VVTTDRLNLAASSPVASPASGELTVVSEPTTAERRSRLDGLRSHRRTWTAIRGFREVLLIGAIYSMYDLTRYLVAGDHDGAIIHGRTLLRWENDLGLAPEHALNKVFSAHIALGLPADYMYATLHYIVTPVILVWMWRRHAGAYSFNRTILAFATIIGLIGFTLVPTAPPRMLPGFIDTMTKFSHYGWWSNAASAPRGLGADTNQYAALPSLHVGWALWCGWQMVRYGRHRITKVLGVLYPVLLSIDVMATANHYFIDVAAGVLVVLVATGIVYLLSAIGLVSRPGTGPAVEAAEENAVRAVT
jgi:hypothetical protein